jgi:hypothetical protein
VECKQAFPKAADDELKTNSTSDKSESTDETEKTVASKELSDYN